MLILEEWIPAVSGMTNILWIAVFSPFRWNAGCFALKNLSHSHSIVAGGFDEMSYATLLTPFTSLIILLAQLARIS